MSNPYRPGVPDNILLARIVELLSNGTGGTGNVVGPASGTNNAIVLFDGATGKLIKNSAVTISGSEVAGISKITAANSGGLLLEANNGTDVALLGAGGGTGATFYGSILAGGSVGLPDTNASHHLLLAAGSDLTADRTLTLTTGDAARTLTINGNATLNQDVSTTASPTFAGVSITGSGSWGSGGINNTPIGATTRATGAFTTASVQTDTSGAILNVRNTVAGAAKYTRASLGNNTNANQFELYTFSSTYTESAWEKRLGGAILVAGSAGLSLVSQTGDVRVFAGSLSTTVGLFSSTGLSVTGNLSCTGALSKGSGSFKISHPLPAKKDTHWLYHSFIEGPYCDLVYRGKATLAAGATTVNLDSHFGMTAGTFAALCRNAQVWAQSASGWAQVKGSVSNGVLTLASRNGESEEVNWLIVAERKDEHIMDANWTGDDGRPVLEVAKTEAEMEPTAVAKP